MEIIRYSEFERLRLRDYLLDANCVDNWEYYDHRWKGEERAFTQFLCPLESPGQVQMVTLDLEEMKEEEAWRILEKLGLELESGMSRAEIEEEFGPALRSHTFVADRISLDFQIGTAEQPYLLSLTVTHAEGLIHLVMSHHPKALRLLLN